MKKLIILEIFTILLDTKIVTAGNIAKKLSISNKTVRNYLHSSNDLLTRFNLMLISKTGSGYVLEGSTSDILKFRCYIEEERKLNHQVPHIERVYYILFKLLKSNYTVYINQLESSLYISKSTLYHDINKAKIIALKFHIILKNHSSKGLALHGDEKNMRTLFYYVIREIRSFDVYHRPQEVDDFIELCFGDNFTNRKITAFLHKFEKKKNVKLALSDFSYLHLMMNITLVRMKQGKLISSIDYTDSHLNSFSMIMNMEESKKIFQDIFLMKVNDSEIFYLSTLFLSLKNTNLVLQNDTKIMQQANKIVYVFASYVYKSCTIKHQDDFEHGLFCHIFDIIKKVKYNFDFSNPFLETIRNEFQLPYELAKQIIPITDEITGIILPEDEISYVAIHIASAIEASLEPINVIFLYEHRFSEQKYSSSLIEAHIKEIKIIHRIKLQDYIDDGPLPLHAILFTTFPYQHDTLPSFQIPAIPNKSFINKLRDIMRDYFIHQ